MTATSLQEKFNAAAMALQQPPLRASGIHRLLVKLGVQKPSRDLRPAALAEICESYPKLMQAAESPADQCALAIALTGQMIKAGDDNSLPFVESFPQLREALLETAKKKDASLSPLGPLLYLKEVIVRLETDLENTVNVMQETSVYLAGNIARYLAEEPKSAFRQEYDLTRKKSTKAVEKYRAFNTLIKDIEGIACAEITVRKAVRQKNKEKMIEKASEVTTTEEVELMAPVKPKIRNHAQGR